MIRTLAFANYRSLRDLKIALDPLTGIAGQNGSGKSNLYRALRLLAALLSPRPAPLIVLNEPEASLHESVLPPLAQLILGAAKRSQILVISHSQQLVAAIESEGSLAAIELLRENDEIRIGGQGLLDEPAWHWL